MNFQAHLDHGQQLTLSNSDGHTQIALFSDEKGHSQAQTSRFSTGNWSKNPQVFGVGESFTVQLETKDGQQWLAIDDNGVRSLDKAPDLEGAKSFELKKTDEAMPQPMQPMAPMKPMAPLKPMN